VLGYFVGVVLFVCLGGFFRFFLPFVNSVFLLLFALLCVQIVSEQSFFWSQVFISKHQRRFFLGESEITTNRTTTEKKKTQTKKERK